MLCWGIMQHNIRRNFEFLYFGDGRHLCPDPKVLDEPLSVLGDLGGVPHLTFQENWTDKIVGGHSRDFSFELRVLEFPGHSVRAYCTRELYPEDSVGASFVTKIRLGNYDIADEFSGKISGVLGNLPLSDREPR